MAMKIGGKYNPETVCLRHWEKLVPEGALSKNMILKELKRLATLVPRKSLALMKSLNKKGFGSPIYDQIQKVIEKRAQYVLKDIADITAV